MTGWRIQPRTGRVHSSSVSSCLGLVRGGVVPSFFGDEWKIASERISIEPRVPSQARKKLSRRGAQIQDLLAGFRDQKPVIQKREAARKRTWRVRREYIDHGDGQQNAEGDQTDSECLFESFAILHGCGSVFRDRIYRSSSQVDCILRLPQYAPRSKIGGP